MRGPWIIKQYCKRDIARVVARPGSGLTEQAIMEYLSMRVARFWLPDRVLFVDEIPKTSVGTFDKKTLRRRYAVGGLS